tara:strand:- start:50 stop:262 length:213 start_codon:yes stop_codon:yes gene_type:complete
MIDNIHRPSPPIGNRPSIALFFLKSLRAALLLITTLILLPFLALVLFLVVCCAYADDAIDGKMENSQDEG